MNLQRYRVLNVFQQGAVWTRKDAERREWRGRFFSSTNQNSRKCVPWIRMKFSPPLLCWIFHQWLMLKQHYTLILHLPHFLVRSDMQCTQVVSSDMYEAICRRPENSLLVNLHLYFPWFLLKSPNSHDLLLFISLQCVDTGLQASLTLGAK